MSKKILLVDDDPAELAAYLRMFHGEFEIETAAGGEEGLDSIRDRGPFGVVISDVGMPGIDGIQFMSRVRQLAPDSVRLIMTGRAEFETALRAINEGHIFTFLTKPCCKAELAKAINAALAEGERRRAPRVSVQLPVRVSRSFSHERAQAGHTLDISATGARLAGLKKPLRRGEVIEIQCGAKKAPFQVVWTGSPATANADQAGVQCLAQATNIWELDLAQQANEEPLLREIALARMVQSRLFPQQQPALQSLDYSGHCIPARHVGGDYYDFLETKPGEIGLVVADVVGKGVAAALMMANLQGFLRNNPGVGSKDLARWLTSVNRHFHKNTECGHYVTVFCGYYCDADRQLRYVNCGHNPPLLLRRSGNLEKLGATATVIGLFREWDCSVAETVLEPGDLLAIYTDGATEATDHNGHEFGEARLLENLRANREYDAAVIVRNVQGAVQRFAAGNPEDDVTLLIGRAL